MNKAARDLIRSIESGTLDAPSRSFSSPEPHPDRISSLKEEDLPRIREIWEARKNWEKYRDDYNHQKYLDQKSQEESFRRQLFSAWDIREDNTFAVWLYDDAANGARYGTLLTRNEMVEVVRRFSAAWMLASTYLAANYVKKDKDAQSS